MLANQDVISQTHPFLDASPDACIHDPLHDEPFGLAEIKCPYSRRNNTPQTAYSSKDFYSLEKTSDGVE